MKNQPNKPGESPEVTSSLSFIWIQVIVIVIAIGLVVVALLTWHLPKISIPSFQFLQDIPSLIWIVLILLIIGGIIWKFFSPQVANFPVKKIINWIVAIIIVLILCYYFPAIKKWIQGDLNKSSQSLTITTNPTENHFSSEIITYGQVYMFQKGWWYKCPIGEQYYGAYATPGDNIEKMTTADGIHWIRIQNQSDKVIFSQQPITAFPY